MGYNLFLSYVVWGNSVRQWLIFTLLVLSFLLALRLFKLSVLTALKKLTEKTETLIDDALLEVFEKRVYPYFYFLVFYFSSKYLSLSVKLQHALSVVGKVAVSLVVITVVSDMVSYLLREFVFSARADDAYKKQYSGIITIVKAVIWCFGVILILDNMGVKISALVAGMGISGIAVALAAQTVLKDLFSYFAILFDRPFEIGDFIVSGEQTGTVEHVGIKTTRLRSLSGEEVVCANSDLIENRLHNYKRMARRRVVVKFGITYESPTEVMRRVPAVLKEIVDSVPGTVFDRAHFAQYGDYSLNYEAVYYVDTADYNAYMDKQQEINLKIKDSVQKLGLRLAYPTRTVYLPK